VVVRDAPASDRLGHVGVGPPRPHDHPFGTTANSASKNVTMTIFDLTTFDLEFAWLRLPLQIPLLWWVWRAAARPIP
jgi:hypothetical protein